MRVARVESYAVAIPFRFAFRHSLAVRTATDSLVVCIRDRDGNVGFGESAPREYVTGETVAGAAVAAREHFLPAFAKCDYENFEAVVDALRAVGARLTRERHAAFCAVELALLDLAGRAFHRCAGDVLGPVVDARPEYSGVVSSDDLDAVTKTCAALVQFDIQSVKVKLGRAQAADVEVLRIARGVLGPDRSLRGDANGAWTARDALARIDAFAPFGLAAIEQPVPAQNIDGLAWLTARSTLPIIADESLVSVDDAQELARRRACHAFNLRISKCGGLLNTARIQAIARDAGIACMLGAHVGETAILTAAGRQFATRSDDLLFREGSYGTLLLEHDIAREDVTLGRSGRAPALTAPGLGIDVDAKRLREFAAQIPARTMLRTGVEEDEPCGS